MKIGWIGTGGMGASMAGHLQQAGHELFVYNRTRAKADALLAAGATWCETPGDVARACEALFTIVGYPHDVAGVYGLPGAESQQDDAAASGDASHTIFGAIAAQQQDERRLHTVVDMTTSGPEIARQIAARAGELDLQALDAPVSGGDVGAREARLAIMVGGSSAESFARVRPLFELMGQKIAYMGPSGAGQSTKLANQTLFAGNMIGTCEALRYAAKAGLDERAVIEVIGSGAAASWTINQLGPRIAAEDFAAGFYVEHFLKDMGLVLEECERLEIRLPGLELVRSLYQQLCEDDSANARLGTQALIKALRNA